MVINNSRWVVFSGLILAGLYLNPASLPAQTVSGTILGTVQDPQGAAIGKAEITAKNLDTGAVRTAIAEDNGTYRISSVPAGPYSVIAAAAGFKTEERSGILVTVGGDVAVAFSLTVGAVSERVEVTGEASQVDTSTSAMGGFVNSTTIRELPLNGRDWLQLALLQPGVTLNSSQPQSDSIHTKSGNGIAISISGGRESDNAFRIDGLIVNDYANAGPGSALHVNLGVDAIREFSVLTNNYSAEYGRGSGGIVNAITKSGTNDYHGSAYYFARNSAFDARNFFDPQTIPPFHRMQVGGAVGGAIKKDKTFFFTNYETLRELRSASSSVSTLSANAHNGIICTNSACTSTKQVAIAPAVKPYLALYPLPNGQVSGDTGVFALGAARDGQENYVIGKIDHYFTQATTLSGSYSYDNAAVSAPDAFDLKIILQPSRRQNVVLNLQHVFSPTLINGTRVGVSRTYAASNVDGPVLNPALADPAMGFVPGRPMGIFTIPGVTGVYAGVGAGLSTTGLNAYGYTAPQVGDDLSWTKGRHSIRVGFDFERIQYNQNSTSTPNGQWTFASVQTFVQGIPSQFKSALPSSNVIRAERMSLIAGYFQDDFRLLPNLTINLGVRYEMGTVEHEVHNLNVNLRNLTDPAVSFAVPLYNNPSLKNFAPRVGFAWDPSRNGKTAIRGGFSMFDIVILPYLFANRLNRSAPIVVSGTLKNPPPSSFPNGAVQLFTPDTATADHIEVNPPRPYKAQWNLNVQRQLTKSMALTVGYVGSSGVHLAHTFQDIDQVPPSLVKFNTALDAYVFPIPAAGQAIQRINPNFASIVATDFSGHSSYHALQANLVQRPIKGLSYQLAYTWSKSIDNGSTGYTDVESNNTVGNSWAFDPRIQRGVSDFDVPHNFVANFLYDLPVPAAVKTHTFTNTLLGGWQIGGIYTRQSGGPFSVKIGGDQAFTGNSYASQTQGGQRPMYVNAPGCSANAIIGQIGNYIMTQCFAFPAPGVLGNEGRNDLWMPVFRDLDFSVFKNQNLWGEKLKMQFRVEAFNILNNTNIQPLVLTIFNGSGQLVSSVGTAQGSTVNTSRQIQLGLRLLF